MTDQQKEIIHKLREFAEKSENYNKGWDIIVEATTDEELLDMFNGDTDEEYATMVELFDGDEGIQRMLPAETYTEAKRRVEIVVGIYEEQRRAAMNEIF
jgi:hypothetical protein